MKNKSRERGMTIPMMALFIVTLFAMAALAVDLGVLYTARTSAQHAADAAALAGAFTFMTPNAPQPDTAWAAAITAASKNSIFGTPVQITSANINVEIAMRRVTVTVPRTDANGVETFFAKAIGWNKVDVQVQAMAEAAARGTGTSCLKPLFIPNTVASSLATTKDACDAGQTLFDSAGNLTSWANSNFNPNSIYDLTPGDPQSALEPSQFYALDFGSGANTYRCTLGQCLSDCGVNLDVIKCGDQFPVETGRMVGPTNQGVDDWTGNPADTWGGQHNGVWSYHPNGDNSVWSMTSRSLGVGPVWDNCAQSISPGYHGQQVQIVGFMEIFAVGMQGTILKAHLVQPISCSTAGGAGGGGNTGSNTGPYGVPVRLVNQAKN